MFRSNSMRKEIAVPDLNEGSEVVKKDCKKCKI